MAMMGSEQSDKIAAKVATARSSIISATVARCVDEGPQGLLFGFGVDTVTAMHDIGGRQSQRPRTLDRFISQAADVAVANIKEMAAIDDPFAARADRAARRAAERAANRLIKDRDYDRNPHWYRDHEVVRSMAAKIVESAIEAWLQALKTGE